MIHRLLTKENPRCDVTICAYISRSNSFLIRKRKLFSSTVVETLIGISDVCDQQLVRLRGLILRQVKIREWIQNVSVSSPIIWTLVPISYTTLCKLQLTIYNHSVEWYFLLVWLPSLSVSHIWDLDWKLKILEKPPPNKIKGCLHLHGITKMNINKDGINMIYLNEQSEIHAAHPCVMMMTSWS